VGWTRFTGVGIEIAGVLPVERNEGMFDVDVDVVALADGSAVVDWSGSRIRCRVNCLGAIG